MILYLFFLFKLYFQNFNHNFNYHIEFISFVIKNYINLNITLPDFKTTKFNCLNFNNHFEYFYCLQNFSFIIEINQKFVFVAYDFNYYQSYY